MKDLDLDEIIKEHGSMLKDYDGTGKYIAAIKCMKEAIHQTLVLASEKATIRYVSTSDGYECWDVVEIDKSSILDVEKLIK